MNPLEMELEEWPWWADPSFVVAVVIIAVAAWWVWSKRAPH